jgi:hypothetical protein
MQALDFARLLGLNPEVHQAVGMISVQIAESLDEAAMRLLATADAERSTPDCIAAEVVSRRRRFAPR